MLISPPTSPRVNIACWEESLEKLRQSGLDTSIERCYQAPVTPPYPDFRILSMREIDALLNSAKIISRQFDGCILIAGDRWSYRFVLEVICSRKPLSTSSSSQRLYCSVAKKIETLAKRVLPPADKSCLGAFFDLIFCCFDPEDIATLENSLFSNVAALKKKDF